MPRPSRLRRILKWVGVVMCVVVLVEVWVSLHWGFFYGNGSLGVYNIYDYIYADASVEFPNPYEYIHPTPESWGLVFDSYWGILNIGVISRRARDSWNGRGRVKITSFPLIRLEQWRSGRVSIVFPQWLLLPMAVLPTAYLFWRDRRPPPGHWPTVCV